jgi:hypothetical protein
MSWYVRYFYIRDRFIFYDCFPFLLVHLLSNPWLILLSHRSCSPRRTFVKRTNETIGISPQHADEGLPIAIRKREKFVNAKHPALL